MSFFLVGLFFVNAQTEQKAVIVFEGTAHDFGTFKEELGYVNHEFKFKNTGSVPLIVSSVRASCGCTTPNWNREPIAPGHTGSIQVRYSARNRPGAFRKTITVSSNASNPKIILNISGTVTPRVKTLTESYPRKAGVLNVKTDQIAFGRIGDHEVRTNNIEIANGTTGDMSLDFSLLPPYLTAKVASNTLKPEERSSIAFSFDAKAKGVYGNVNEPIKVKINGQEATFTLTALVQEDFSKLTEQEIENAPVAVIDPYIVNFGSLAKGSNKTYEFIIKNEGKSDLIIRQISTTDKELSLDTPPKPIKPGHSAKILVKMNLTDDTGRKNFMVSIVQNDPKRPTANLRLMGNVTN